MRKNTNMSFMSEKTDTKISIYSMNDSRLTTAQKLIRKPANDEEELTQMQLLKQILDQNIERHTVDRDPDLFKIEELPVPPKTNEPPNKKLSSVFSRTKQL